MNILDNNPEPIPSNLADSSRVGPSPRLWDMKWFAYLAAPLLCVTIIIPVIGGSIIRWFFRDAPARIGYSVLLFILAVYVIVGILPRLHH